MRVDRNSLIRIAKETAQERAFNDRDIIAAYLTGSLADDGLVPPRQGGHELMTAGCGRGGHDLCVACLGPAQPEVVGYRGVEQVGRLRHVCDAASGGRRAVHQRLALLWLDEALERDME